MGEVISSGHLTALRLAQILAEAGINCAIVGGAVRDGVYGVQPKDFDVAVFDDDHVADLIEFFWDKFGTNITHRLEGGGVYANTDGLDTFNSCWSDWVKVVNERTNVQVDIFSATPLYQGERLDSQPSIVKSTGRILLSFDVTMNQQALVIYNGSIIPILGSADKNCIQLRELSAEREQRMRVKAAQFGLEYVPYDSFSGVVTLS